MELNEEELVEEIDEYEEECEKIIDENQKYLEMFADYLEGEGLADKTIKRHLKHVEFYINEFLCDYEPHSLDAGCYQVDAFLGDWFIRKAMWSSVETIKENCASLKKFYKLMLENDVISKDDYKELTRQIKENKEVWLENVETYNNGDM